MQVPGQDVAALRAEVVARRPVDERERDAVTLFVDALDDLARPFDEAASPVHVTASAIVTGERGVLLHRHRRLGLWLQPGGHIEPGEAPWEAAVRETREETGIDVELFDLPPRVLHVDVHPGPRGHTHLDVRYHLTAPPVDPDPPEGESQEVRWMTWHEAITIADPGLEGVLRALQPGEPVLRDARPDDALAAAHVYVRSRRFALPTVPPVHAELDIARWLADEVIGRYDTVVADLDGVVVGLLVLDVRPGDVTVMEQLYLDPAWIGRELGARLVELARERSPDAIELWTFRSNVAARRFYERLGFVAVESTDGSGNEEREPDVRYRSERGTSR